MGGAIAPRATCSGDAESSDAKSREARLAPVFENAVFGPLIHSWPAIPSSGTETCARNPMTRFLRRIGTLLLSMRK